MCNLYLIGCSGGSHQWATLYHAQGRQGRPDIQQHEARILPALEGRDDCAATLPPKGALCSFPCGLLCLIQLTPLKVALG